MVLSQAVPSFPCLSSLVVFKSNGFKLCPAQFQDLKAQMGRRKWSVRFGQSPPPSIQATESEQNEQRQANIQEVRAGARDGSLGRNEFKTHIKKKRKLLMAIRAFGPSIGGEDGSLASPAETASFWFSRRPYLKK